MGSAATQPPIAIIGAGPAGLMLARHLTLSNIPFTVFERDESPTARQVSGTLDVHPGSGQLALSEAGLIDQFNATARHNVRTRFVDSQAKLLVDLLGEADEKDQRPEIDRVDLQKILQDSIDLSTVQWGTKIQSVDRKSSGQISIHMTDGSIQSGFKLVVGCDGAWSKVRPLFTSVTPQYSGTTFLATTVRPGDAMYASCEEKAGGGNYLAIRGIQKIFLYYLGDRSYQIYVGTDFERELGKEVLENPGRLWEEVLEKDFKEWTTELTDLVRRSANGYRPWPFYQLPMEALKWEAGGVKGATWVGEGAHVTVPTGDGVNNAMFDSYELARQIAKYWPQGQDLDRAVVEYEKEMIPRAREAIQEGETMLKVLFGPDAPDSMLKHFGVGGGDH